MKLVQSENSYKVRILVTKRLFVQSEFVQSEGRTKREIAVLCETAAGEVRVEVGQVNFYFVVPLRGIKG